MEINIGEIIVEDELKIGDIQLDVVKVEPGRLEDLVVTPSSEEQNFNHPDSSGYDNVKVKAVETDSLNITPTTQSQQHVGLYGTVNVAAVNSSIDSDIKPGNIKSGVNILGVEGTVEQLIGEEIAATPATTQQVITPSAGKTGITKVTISAVDNTIDADIKPGNIKSGVEILGVQGTIEPLAGEEITVTPATTQQVITPSQGKNAITKATVKAVDRTIDSDIQPGNIRNGVAILGVEGTINELIGEEVAITPATTAQVITPGAGKTGITKATVAAVDSSIDGDIKPGNIKSGVEILGVAGTIEPLAGETVQITPTTSQQVITPSAGKNAITQATVSAVNSTIDSDIQPGNIKDGVSILGVAGTVVELAGEEVTITPTTTQQVITPSAGKNAITQATVSAVDSSIDSNIIPENIKKGVEILGVEGTAEGGGGTLITKTLTENKTYNATDDGADGYSSVNVELFFKSNGLPYFKNMIFSSDVTSATILFDTCTYLETVKYEAGATSLNNSLFRNCTNLEKVELPNTLTTIQARAFQSCSSLSTINLPNSLTSIPTGNQPFQSCTSLENVTIENGFNCNYLNLSSSTKYSVETMVSWFNALADRTGDTAYTLTIGATNLNKLTAEQKAIATNKNWTLA